MAWTLLVSHCCATSFANGSSELGTLNKAWVNSRIMGICGAMDHLSFTIHKHFSWSVYIKKITFGHEMYFRCCLWVFFWKKQLKFLPQSWNPGSQQWPHGNNGYCFYLVPLWCQEPILPANAGFPWWFFQAAQFHFFKFWISLFNKIHHPFPFNQEWMAELLNGLVFGFFFFCCYYWEDHMAFC